MLSPVSIKLPPLKVDVKLSGLGKYLFGRSYYDGILEPYPILDVWYNKFFFNAYYGYSIAVASLAGNYFS